MDSKRTRHLHVALYKDDELRADRDPSMCDDYKRRVGWFNGGITRFCKKISCHEKQFGVKKNVNKMLRSIYGQDIGDTRHEGLVDSLSEEEYDIRLLECRAGRGD